MANAVDGIKKCCSSDCSRKPVSEFSKNRDAADGFQDYCRECHSRRYQARKDKVRRQMDSRLYGLLPGDYDRMLAAQGGNCAVCGLCPDDGQRLAVDHDHATGKVRALLCRYCNTALGLLREDPERCSKLAEYAAIHGPGIVLEVR